MQEITVLELKRRTDAREQLNVIDVREPSEYEEYNIGGLLIPLSQIVGMQTEQIDHLKDQELIIHCRSGKRSMQACLYLESMGFTNVKNLVGGVEAWKQLVDGKGE